MGLKRMECKNCKTIYYGVEDITGDADKYCYLCSTTRKFLKIFGLEDIPISEIDFNRVRVPKWEECDDMSNTDWRNFIPEDIKKMWSQLSFEARVMAVMFAEREARKEERC